MSVYQVHLRYLYPTESVHEVRAPNAKEAAQKVVNGLGIKMAEVIACELIIDEKENA